MVKAIENKSRSLKIKDVYLQGENLILDEAGEQVDLYALIQKVFGEGVDLTISVTAKDDTDIVL